MNRSVGEITFDHQQEKITEAINFGDKNRYRRNEQKLKKVLYSYVFVIVPILYIIYPAILINALGYYYSSNNSYMSYYSNGTVWKKFGKRLINYSMTTLGVSSFSYLIYLIRKYHRLEYETNIKQMSLFFLNIVILLVI